MPTEFRCTQCQKLLRTPDETAGKQAKCPSCGAVLPIPTASEPSSAPPTPGPYDTPEPRADVPPPLGPPSANPYASPTAYDSPASHAAARGGIRPTKLDLGEALGRTWAAYKSQLGMCLLIVLIGQLLGQVFSQVTSIMVQVAGAAIDANNPAIIFPLFIIQWVVSMVFSLWIGAGIFLGMLKISRGIQSEFADLFRGGPYLLNIILSTLLLYLGGFVISLPAIAAAGITYFMTGEDHPLFLGTAVIGSLITLIPLVIYFLAFSQYQFLILDQQLGPLDALYRSRDIMSGNIIMYIVLGLLSSAIMILGFFALCVGALFTIPYAMLLYAMAYLLMSGQPTYVDGAGVDGGAYDEPTLP